MRRAATVAIMLALAAGTGRGAERTLSGLDATAGKPLFLQYCSACHGERGDGNGTAAAFVDPRPRNLVKGPFKLRTTPSGQPPATADILRTIERGIPGTAMPPFSFLPEADRRKLAAYVLRLADVLDEPEPPPLAPAPAPPATPASVAQGRQLYADSGCGSCHGDAGKGDGPSAPDLKDAEGRPIAPRDFTAGVFRGGGDRLDLYYRIATGMDGTPMPAYADVLTGEQLYAVVDYVTSLAGKPAPPALPADPIEAGRAVAAAHGCRGCHVLDDGKGGDAGPDLRVSAQKLDPAWVRTFLAAPEAQGKIYPWRVARMPHIPFADGEIDALVRYLAAVGKRTTPFTVPDPAGFPPEQVAAGKNVFVIRCAQCHGLGKVVETPPMTQQGPDLIHVARRVDWAWAKTWITNPQQIDPATKMVVPGLTPAEVEQVRMFLWKTSLENDGAPAPPAVAGR
ncbi:MAG TPA: c-type cytochrome [Candidatus Binatia bacterium]|nr:c-type cytochrome [Candidatus Binatia bacterium]